MSDDQKRAGVTHAEKMLNCFLYVDNNKFANVVTGDETCVHETCVQFYEPRRKVRNKIWAMKSTKRSCIARRTMSIQKTMYAI